MSLAAAVIIVSDLDRSGRFYSELLALDVELHTDNAVLLAAVDGSHLVLRSLQHAVRGTGFLGVQCLIWSVEAQEELQRCERTLNSWNALVSTWNGQGSSTVEGHDPDRLPLLVTYPSGLGPLTTDFPARVFAY